MDYVAAPLLFCRFGWAAITDISEIKLLDLIPFGTLLSLCCMCGLDGLRVIVFFPIYMISCNLLEFFMSHEI